MRRAYSHGRLGCIWGVCLKGRLTKVWETGLGVPSRGLVRNFGRPCALNAPALSKQRWCFRRGPLRRKRLRGSRVGLAEFRLTGPGPPEPCRCNSTTPQQSVPRTCDLDSSRGVELHQHRSLGRLCSTKIPSGPGSELRAGCVRHRGRPPVENALGRLGLLQCEARNHGGWAAKEWS